MTEISFYEVLYIAKPDFGENMKSRSSIKKEKISHLQWCLDKLMFKENPNNSEEIEVLYRKIFKIISEMELLEDEEALCYYRKEVVTGRIRELLLEHKIELVV